MITFISFVLVLLGALNWLSIGALQYDFVAGLFGSQASMFSRIIYFFIGVAAIWIVIQAFRGKGRIKINDDGFDKKKDVLRKESTLANTEAGRDYSENYERRNTNSEAGRDYSENYERNITNSEAGRDYLDTNNREDSGYMSQGFPRDYSRYNSQKDSFRQDTIQESKPQRQNNEVDYKSLGYKDFHEEDLDKK